MSRQFKIFLLVVLSVFSTLNLSANDTFFSIEKSSNSVEELANGVGDLLDPSLISQMTANGVNFTESSLKFVSKNNDNLIMFLDNGSPSAGLQHIIDGKWTGNPNFQALFNNKIDEMVENMFKAINNGNYVEKIVDSQNRLSYIYKVQTTQGLKEFKFATGSNGYIVSFIPNWL